MPLILVGCTPAGPPNLLVITLDTARADRFGFHGNPDGLTPHADRLAEQATVFDDCVAPMGTTTPSHATLLTGLRIRSHGVRTNTAKLADDFDTVAEILDRNGYQTAAFVSMTTLIAHGGLHQGFRVASDRPGVSSRSPTRSGIETNELARPWFEYLGETRDRWFAWIHYYEPHSPYAMTDHAAQKLDGYAGRFAEGIDANLFNMGVWLRTPEDIAAIRVFYDGQVVEADRRVGELLERLRSLDLLSNTVVVLTSDHGQALGDHDYPGHGPAIWQSVVHVPLVIWDSRDTRARRVEERVGLIDVAPTLLDLAGVPVPEAMEGRSLLPALSGGALADRFYVTEIRPPLLPRRNRYYHPTPYSVGVYEGRFKLMGGRGPLDLFDLSADPAELAPLTEADAPETFRRLALQLNQYDANDTADTTPEEVPDELVEGLRALGYAQ